MQKRKSRTSKRIRDDTEVNAATYRIKYDGQCTSYQERAIWLKGGGRSQQEVLWGGVYQIEGRARAKALLWTECCVPSKSIC